MIEGFWGVVLNETELDACFRVTRVYSKRFENPKISGCLYSADYRICLPVPNPAKICVRESLPAKLKKKGKKKVFSGRPR